MDIEKDRAGFQFRPNHQERDVIYDSLMWASVPLAPGKYFLTEPEQDVAEALLFGIEQNTQVGMFLNTNDLDLIYKSVVRYAKNTALPEEAYQDILTIIDANR